MDSNQSDPQSLNFRSLTGLVVFAALGAAGLFVLPLFQRLGLAFRPAFWLVLAIEFVALVGVVVSVLTLHRAREFDHSSE
jgi:hypothetical protein